MTDLNIALVLIGGLVLVLSAVSDLLKQHGVSDVLVALVLGVAVGPVGLGLLDPSAWGDGTVVLEEATRLAVGVGLMGAALRLPGGYFGATWRAHTVLVVGAMVGMWLTSSLLIAWILALPAPMALLIGAVVTPTDPVVASSIVTGTVAERNLPGRIPCLITAEAGLNDGLALPLVLLGIALVGGTGLESGVPAFIGQSLWQVGGAVAMGAALGTATAHLLVFAERRMLIERAGYLAIVVSLALLTLGSVRLVGSDGLLAVFVAGVAFGRVVPLSEREDAGTVAATVDLFFSLPVFTLIGMVLPWAAWAALGWHGVALALAVLVLRRLPVVLAIHRWVTPLRSVGDALFVGWFGPIGVAATFYAAHALRETGRETVFAVALLLVAASVVAQGLTATPLMRLYSRTCDTAKDDDDPGMDLAHSGRRALSNEETHASPR
ncbi:cation:proton antiporter [Rubrivirga sp.]|uniref:cation:proton antiporter domain-containing protein n=1 Tax=Rubrivirga sp. TaxID=1885344 RepID=UPI003B521990